MATTISVGRKSAPRKATPAGMSRQGRHPKYGFNAFAVLSRDATPLSGGYGGRGPLYPPAGRFHLSHCPFLWAAGRWYIYMAGRAAEGRPPLSHHIYIYIYRYMPEATILYP